MKLYEITQSILDCIDEDGEIVDIEKFDLLQIEKNTKIDNIISLYKSINYEIKAIKQEEDMLLERRKRKEKNAENIKIWIAEILGGSKFESSKNKIMWRKSESTSIIDESLISDTFKEEIITIEIDKAAIKNAIKSGVIVAGAWVEIKNNIQIK